MNNKLVLQSMASDLKRVALSLHRGSPAVAARFAQEALRRRNELDWSQLPGYLENILHGLDKASANAEDALMYSTLLQNYSLKYT